MINPEDGKRLLRLARNSVESYFENREPECEDVAERFSQKQGVFVTLHKNGQLRGCIGFSEPVHPLYRAIIEAARAAAFHDPRFPKVEKEELSKIRFEISVLTVPELIEVKKPEDYLKKIEIGRDGLIIRNNSGSGLLLPQVFTEWNADIKKALEMTCEKAMLEKDCWQDLNSRFYKFQTQFFSE